MIFDTSFSVSSIFSPDFLVCCNTVFSMCCHGSANTGKTRYSTLIKHANENPVFLNISLGNKYV